MNQPTIDQFERLALTADVAGLDTGELTGALLDRLEATWGASRTAALVAERRSAIASGLSMALSNAAEFRDLYRSLFEASCGGDPEFLDDPVQGVLRAELCIAAEHLLGADAWTDEIADAFDALAAVVFRFVLSGLTIHAACRTDEAPAPRTSAAPSEPTIHFRRAA
ncbi:MAG: hypothetical protein AAF995_01220 [Planctomycetota bacterium]